MNRLNNLTGKLTNYKSLLILFAACVIKISCESQCDSNPCMYGICLDDYNSSSYSCYCIDGYTGINCEINWDDCWSDPCLNGGICSDAIAAYNCTCTEGFIGFNCEEHFNQCLYTPCLNNGTCIDRNGFTCQCQDGYSGDYCEIDASVCNNTVCKNSGDCIEGPGLSFSCRCADGWAGEFCEEDVDECLASPCENGGLCINAPATYTCACLFGFTGKNCDKFILPCDSNPCKNNAVCLVEDNQTVCYCVPDYHGSLCEMRYDDCEAKFAVCDNGGTCVDGVNSFTCSCPADYHGQTCAEYDPASTTVTDRGDEFLYSSSASATYFQSTFTTPYGKSDTPILQDNGKSDTQITEELTESTTRFSTTEPGTVKPLEENTSFASTDVEFIYSSETLFEINSTASKEELFTTEAITFSSTEETTNISRITIDDEAALAVSSTDFSHSVQTGTETIGNGEKSSTFISSTESEGGIDASTLTTESLFDQNLTSVTSTYNLTCQNSSIECNCNYPEGCSPPPDISNAAFNGKSFIRQNLSADGEGQVRILIRVKTKSNNGILVHAFFDDDRYILLHMELGQLKFQFSCGLQTMLLGEIDSPINNGYDVDIEMRFQYLKASNVDKCSATLFLNKTVAMSGEQVVSNQDYIPREARLHLGGIPLAFTHYFPHVAVGFIGCMSLLKVNNVQRHLIRDSIDSFQIEECTSFLCLSNPCKNFGACQEVNGRVQCNCIAGYTGEVCERSACDDNPCHYGAPCISSPGTGFICVCPLGTHGLLCEEDISIVQPTFTVFTPGISSYIAYALTESVKDNVELKLRLIPQSIEQISLIAFIGQTSPYRDLSDHLAVTYVRGYIMLTWDLGSGVRRIFTSSALTTKTHRPHTLRVGRKGRDGWLSVDGLGNVTGRSAGSMTSLDVAPILYIGGHKSKNFETLPHDLPLHTGFVGCIFDVELRIGNVIFPLAKTGSATGRGVGECHRNECTHRSCKNGAVCLNHGPTYSCVCTKDWEGPDCSKAIKNQ